MQLLLEVTTGLRNAPFCLKRMHFCPLSQLRYRYPVFEIRTQFLKQPDLISSRSNQSAFKFILKKT
jgi:hypothetical protein